MRSVTTIGLIRHFPVARGLPSRASMMTAADVKSWYDEYERSDVIAKGVDLGGVDWRRCYASSSPRAQQTAQAIFQGPIVELDQLREPNIRQFDTGALKLPFAGWRWLLRLAWMTSHPSQREVKTTFLSNIEGIIETLRSHAPDPTLVVSHAGVMMFLRKAMLRRDFKGPRFAVPEPGRLYVFEGRWE
ncbi:MAG: histidine phosphatase family protein [Hyphomicrobium sp.]|uniref:histidine phosphatase family protein n=1 Tax=Hyphomicrobium sp. TaxID=82 RepID=UPI003D0BD48D